MIKSKIIIGLTGGTGAGKTSALQALQRLDGYILDCDAVYHEMLKSDEALRSAIRNTFGDVFEKDGALNRQKLGNIVFKDPDALDTLNGIIYTHLPRELGRRMEKRTEPVIGLDAINLIESGLGKLCDRTVGVIAPAETRVGRIMQRDNIPESYARLRVNAQKPDDFYRENCTDILENDLSTPEAFAEKAYGYFRELIEICKEEKQHV
ncbi:MAG: dephospho-CoA kinase [Clostridiales bacterium]|nr:dephospho-CoA kinase [Clostridiales bacterium]